MAFDVEIIPTREAQTGDTIGPLTVGLRGALLRGDEVDWNDAWANAVFVTEPVDHNTGDWSSIITDGHRELFPATDGAVVRWRAVLD